MYVCVCVCVCVRYFILEEHIYTMECYAAIKNDESFIGMWMNLETVILSKLTQEQKIKHHMVSLIGGC